MKELADVTFEELKNARSNGAHAFFKKRGEDKKLKRLNKNRCFICIIVIVSACLVSRWVCKIMVAHLDFGKTTVIPNMHSIDCLTKWFLFSSNPCVCETM